MKLTIYTLSSEVTPFKAFLKPYQTLRPVTLSRGSGSEWLFQSIFRAHSNNNFSHFWPLKFYWNANSLGVRHVNMPCLIDSMTSVNSFETGIETSHANVSLKSLLIDNSFNKVDCSCFDNPICNKSKISQNMPSSYQFIPVWIPKFFSGSPGRKLLVHKCPLWCWIYAIFSSQSYMVWKMAITPENKSRHIMATRDG